MSNHEQYEILCAWVASGRASPEDLAQLTDHLPGCDDCQGRLSDFAMASAQIIPLNRRSYGRNAVPSGMTARFIERAKLQGIPLQRPLRPHRFAWVAVTAVVVVAAVFAIGSVPGARTVKPAAQAAASQSHVSTAEAATRPVPVAEDSRQSSQRRADVAPAQHEIAALESEIKSLQQDRIVSDSANAALSARLAGLENDNANLRAQTSTKDSQIADLEADLKKQQTSNIDEIADLTHQKAQMEKLKSQLAQRENQLERERQLLAATTQARDLIVARNLHIIDVHDNDSSGRQRPFGRIFYTEGQSLIFYAYDLDIVARRDTKVYFHVWGGTLGGQVQAKNLGIFHSEDAGRWVLTCDDPRVLAKINTVFVTMEPAQGDFDQPNGRRILYAFLGDPANHP